MASPEKRELRQQRQASALEMINTLFAGRVAVRRTEAAARRQSRLNNRAIYVQGNGKNGHPVGQDLEIHRSYAVSSEFFVPELVGEQPKHKPEMAIVIAKDKDAEGLSARSTVCAAFIFKDAIVLDPVDKSWKHDSVRSGHNLALGIVRVAKARQNGHKA